MLLSTWNFVLNVSVGTAVTRNTPTGSLTFVTLGVPSPRSKTAWKSTGKAVTRGIRMRNTHAQDHEQESMKRAHVRCTPAHMSPTNQPTTNQPANGCMRSSPNECPIDMHAPERTSGRQDSAAASFATHQNYGRERQRRGGAGVYMSFRMKRVGLLEESAGWSPPLTSTHLTPSPSTNTSTITGP